MKRFVGTISIFLTILLICLSYPLSATAEEVHIPDLVLRMAVKHALGIPPDSDYPITTQAMADLTELMATNSYDEADPNITDLTGLEHAVNLTFLRAPFHAISDLSPLSGLTNLTKLGLNGNPITDLSPLSGLTNLEIAELESGDITDISALSGLTKLRHVGVAGNVSDISALSGLTNLTDLRIFNSSITDISPLSGLTNLDFLWLSDGAISDISPLSGLTKLTAIRIWSNVISDISALSGLTKLTYLSLSSNVISDISALSGLTKLKYLDLWGNDISDISFLSKNSGLGSGDEIELRQNPLSYESIHTHIPALQSRGATVEFDDTPTDEPTAPSSDKPTAPHYLDVYWLERGTEHTILKFNSADTDIVYNVISLPGQATGDLALDLVNGKVYWTDSKAGKICRANLDGTQMQDVVAGLKVPNGIALDVAGGKMYWTDWAAKTVSRANMDGTAVEKLIRIKNGLLGDIALDVAAGKMYGVDFGRDVIWRANLDGSHEESLVTAGLSTPFAIALDVTGGKMYWADKRTHKIQCANLDGTGVEDILTNTKGVNNPNSIALDVEGGTMYWTESSPGEVGLMKIARLDGSSVQTLLSSNDPRGIALGTSMSIDSIPTTTVTETQPDVQQAPEDVNNDGTVTIADLVVIAQNYGKIPNGDAVVAAADVNHDGIVNAEDFVLVAGVIDNAAAPSAHPPELTFLSATDVRLMLAEVWAADLADPAVRRGIRYLEQLLAAMIPHETILLANYPNPFNPETWIPYRLATDAPVRLRIYDQTGRAVRTIDLGHRRAAAYESRIDAIYWDGRNDLGERVTSGLYFYTLTAGGYKSTRKMLVGK